MYETQEIIYTFLNVPYLSSPQVLAVCSYQKIKKLMIYNAISNVIIK